MVMFLDKENTFFYTYGYKPESRYDIACDTLYNYVRERERERESRARAKGSGFVREGGRERLVN